MPVAAKPIETVDGDRARRRCRPSGCASGSAANRLEWTWRPEGRRAVAPGRVARRLRLDSAYGLWLKGKELLRQRDYALGRARPSTRASRKDPHYVPALADMALLRYRVEDDAGGLRPGAPRARDRHLRPGRELLLRPRRA